MKSYIGVTSRSINERWKEHQGLAQRGSTQHIHCSMRKHGVQNFRVEILEEGWDPEIGKNIREPYWISILKPEYNHTAGGDGQAPGYKFTSKAKVAAHAANLGNQSKIACPHCNTIGALNGMNRYHFNNCKYKGVK